MSEANEFEVEIQETVIYKLTVSASNTKEAEIKALKQRYEHEPCQRHLKVALAFLENSVVPEIIAG